MEQEQGLVKFEEKAMVVREVEGKKALTAQEVGTALDYAEPRKHVMNLFNARREEFEEGVDYSVLELRTEAGMRETTVFFESGIILLTAFSEQPKAKEFRKWAKHVLARELRQSPYTPAIMEGLARKLIEVKLEEALERSRRFNKQQYRRMLFYRKEKQLSIKDTAKLLDCGEKTIKYYEHFVDDRLQRLAEGDFSALEPEMLQRTQRRQRMPQGLAARKEEGHA